MAPDVSLASTIHCSLLKLKKRMSRRASATLLPRRQKQTSNRLWWDEILSLVLICSGGLWINRLWRHLTLAFAGVVIHLWTNLAQKYPNNNIAFDILSQFVHVLQVIEEATVEASNLSTKLEGADSGNFDRFWFHWNLKLVTRPSSHLTATWNHTLMFKVGSSGT